jgi:hypothetical protein
MQYKRLANHGSPAMNLEPLSTHVKHQVLLYVYLDRSSLAD